LGNKVEAQSDAASGTVYFLTDGHGSTRALTNTSGAVVAGTTYDYDAYGQPLNFTASFAKTNWLFAGDGVYDSVSGWTYHLARWRDQFRFTSPDSLILLAGAIADANLYSYAAFSPTTRIDPSGFINTTELTTVEGEGLKEMSQSASADIAAGQQAHRQAQLIYSFLITIVLGTMLAFEKLLEPFKQWEPNVGPDGHDPA
jgi:RHS repeat-associated protein